ncbi:MAG: RNA polymerase sigma factor [Acidobacteriota bacterium]
MKVIPYKRPDTMDDSEDAALRARLEAAVKRVCGPSMTADVDDLVQMAMLRVMDLRRRDPERTFSSSYLQRTAYSALIDEIRRRKRRAEESLEEEDSGPIAFPDLSADPERLAQSKQLGRMMNDCLARLASPRRMAVVLHLQGHNVPESAEILEWGRKRVENLVYRGLADLRRCLTTKGVTI